MARSSVPSASAGIILSTTRPALSTGFNVPSWWPTRADKMKLATFFDGASARLGLVEGDEIVDVATAGADIPASVLDLLRAGNAGREAVARAARSARRIPLAQVKLGPPIAAPRKFLGLAL